MFLNSYTFRIAVIIAIGYVIGDFISSPVSYYISYGIVFAVKPTLGESIQGTILRMLGIISGGFIGIMMVIHFSLNSLVLVIGLLLIILFCNVINKPEVISQASSTFILVTLVHTSGAETYYWERLSYHAIGAIMGTIVNILLPPPSSVQQLQAGLKQILTQLGQLYQMLGVSYLQDTFTENKEAQQGLNKKIHALLIQNSKLLKLAEVELEQGLGKSEELQLVNTLHQQTQVIMLSLKEMEQLLTDKEGEAIQELLLNELSYLIQSTAETFDSLSQISLLNNSQLNKIMLPNLPEALAALESKLESLDVQEKEDNYDLNEVMNFSAFLVELRAIANHLNHLTQSLIPSLEKVRE